MAEDRFLRGLLGRVALDNFRCSFREHVAASHYVQRDDIDRLADRCAAAGRRQDRTDFECVRGARRAGKQAALLPCIGARACEIDKSFPPRCWTT